MQSAPHEHEPLSVSEAAAAVATAALLLIFVSGLVYPLGVSLATVALVQVLCFIAPSIALALRRGRYRWGRVLGLIPTHPRDVAGACLAGLGIAVLNVLLVLPVALRVAPPPQTDGLEALAAGPLWAVLLALALAPALCEEVLFRGVLCRALRPRLGAAAAIGVSAALFAASHLSAARAAPTFVLGVFAGMALLRSRSLVPAIGLHLVHNGAILVADRHLSVEELSNNIYVLTITAGVFASVTGIGLVRRSPRAAPAPP